MPNLQAMDEGIRRRVVVIPFRNNLTEEQIDRRLAEKFRREYPAILTWLIQGYHLYKKRGFKPPSAVLEATGGYFTEQDVFKQFVDENYVVDAYGKIYAKRVYTDYRQWCEENGEKYVSNVQFSKELLRLGIEKHKDKHGTFYGLAPNGGVWWYVDGELVVSKMCQQSTRRWVWWVEQETFLEIKYNSEKFLSTHHPHHPTTKAKNNAAIMEKNKLYLQGFTRTPTL